MPAAGERSKQLGDPAQLALGADGDAHGLAVRHAGQVNCWFADGHVQGIGSGKPYALVNGLDQLGPPGRLPRGNP